MARLDACMQTNGHLESSPLLVHTRKQNATIFTKFFLLEKNKGLVNDPKAKKNAGAQENETTSHGMQYLSLLPLVCTKLSSISCNHQFYPLQIKCEDHCFLFWSEKIPTQTL